VCVRPVPIPIHPALLQHAQQRAQNVENRIADQITRFAALQALLRAIMTGSYLDPAVRRSRPAAHLPPTRTACARQLRHASRHGYS